MERLNKIYKTLGQNIIDVLPDLWTKAELNFRAGNNFAEFSGSYTNSENHMNNLPVHDFSDEIDMIIIELFKLTKKGNNHWKSGTFTLYPDNNFDIKFEY